jgi:hypothetical protein
MGEIRNQFKEIYKKYNIENIFTDIPCKENYTSIEILKYLKKINGDTLLDNNNEKIEPVTKYKTEIIKMANIFTE